MTEIKPPVGGIDLRLAEVFGRFEGRPRLTSTKVHAIDNPLKKWASIL